MNIFWLEGNVTQCAEYHCDKHVVKQIVEYAQLMSTAHRVLDNIPNDERAFYKKTHVNHPCAIWTRENSANYYELNLLWIELCREYKYRYGRKHSTYEKLYDSLYTAPRNIKHSLEITKPPRCMPEIYRVESVVQSYRNYYIGAKQHIAQWKNRPIPYWYTLMEDSA